jgi:hypothetical protein
MESADINTAFHALFQPLRRSIRRGMSTTGQLYGIEMDPCLPGELLGTDWIPPASRGLDDPSLLADAGHRVAVFRRLLAEPRAESIFAYVCERTEAHGQPVLYVELACEDGVHGATHLIRPGSGWQWRELLAGPHRRLGPTR